MSTLSARNRRRRVAQLRRSAQADRTSASPRILAGFAIFSLADGTHLPGGLVVLHPAPARIPAAVLSLVSDATAVPSAPGRVSTDLSRLDLRAAREVRAPDRRALYPIPGLHTLCVYATGPAIEGAGIEAGGGCQGSVALALQNGGGEAQMTKGHQIDFGITARNHPTLRITISRGRTRTITPIDGIVYLVS